MSSYGIHWFRRDLRIHGNEAFLWSHRKYQGRVLGIFIFDKKFLSRTDFSHNRFHFFLKTLEKLKSELEALGTDLLFLDEGPFAGFDRVLQSVKGPSPQSVSWCRDYEPFARARDQKLEDYFKKRGIETHIERDHLLIEPNEVVKASDPEKPFQVFTPYFRQWLKVFRTEEVEDRLARFSKKAPTKIQPFRWGEFLEMGAVPTFESYLKRNAARVTVPIPEAGVDAAASRLKQFAKKLEAYPQERDIPGRSGTSGLSIFFKNGTLTVAEVIHRLKLDKTPLREGSGAFVYLKELAWREFYYYILYHFPHVESESFNPKYRHLKWENNEKWFQAWKEGRTGFPIVDAGMRQLRDTGWMHNRVRMIVASFLTKDLLIDYRWGERYFMEQLLDGDLAPNNGGWQWAASTGCDPQPYFRVFNPTLQGEKFDPSGSYIKRYLPDREKVAPIVDHAEQREAAIALYKS